MALPLSRRSLGAAALLAPALPGVARGQASRSLVTEEFTVPSAPGIEVFLRSKRPEGAATGPSRTLLMLHGSSWPSHTAYDLPLGGLSWMDYIAGRGFDVWCLDLRGYGRSTRPPGMAQPATANPPLVRNAEAIADVTAAMAFIRERRGIARLGLFGWSWGAALAGQFAAEQPALVERLVLYGARWLPPSGGEPWAPPTAAWRETTQAEARRHWLDGAPEGARAALIPPGWFEFWAGLTWATDPDGLRRNPSVVRIPNGSLADTAETFGAGRAPYDPARVTAPTLIVLGEWDTSTPPAMATALFQALTRSPGKRMVVLAEGTHMMALERNRGALYQSVQGFLEEAPA